MKKIILILITSLTPLIAMSQKLTKNEVDEFENKIVKETSWITFTSTSQLYSYVRLRQVEDNYYFNVKMLKNFSGHYMIDSGDVFLIKFADGEIMRLNNLTKTHTTTGGGAIGLVGSKALGAGISCELPKDALIKLRDKEIVKVRVYTSTGYFETKVKKNQSKRINELSNLLL